MPLRKLKKLVSMSPAELAFRTGEFVRAKQERGRYPQELAAVRDGAYTYFGPALDAAVASATNGSGMAAFDEGDWRKKLPVVDSPSSAEGFKSRLPREFEKSIARADAFLRNEFSFLGVSCSYPDGIEWQADPRTGTPFPTGFFRDIKIFQNAKGVDIKHVWELNRLQFLIEIAKAWHLTGEARYREKIDELVADWQAKNPYKTGVAWTSALEVGVRAFSLIWTLSFYLARPGGSPETVRRILELLQLSASFIEENLSIYFSPYNHLIGEVAALFAIGYLFPGLRGSEKRERRGWKLLVEQADKQFHPDGMTVEQATFYHHFTLGFYIQSVQIRRLNGDAVPEPMMRTIESALDASMHLTRPDGTLPWIGDIDAARSIYFTAPAHWDFRGFQLVGASWFEREDMRFLAGESSEEAYWLLGEAACDAAARIPAKPPERRVTQLPDSGYTIIRSGWDKTSHFGLIDCGPIAHGVHADGTPSAAHGHADLLSIELAPHGESLLIDPGFSNYRGDQEWHAWFRSTAAHNTLVVDGESQALQTGLLNWAHAPAYRELAKIQGTRVSGLCGEHTGFHRLPGGPTHRRTFAFLDNAFWLTVDVLFSTQGGDAIRRIDQPFHFPAGTKVELQHGHAGLSATGSRAGLEIATIASRQTEISTEVHEGGSSPSEGWVSPTYRQRTAAPMVVNSLQAPMPICLVTAYVPFEKSTAGGAALACSASELKFKVGTVEYAVTCHLEQMRTPVSGGAAKLVTVEIDNVPSLHMTALPERPSEAGGSMDCIIE